jgi:capsular polysaccharide transport system ATP-binding protein
VIKVSNVWKRYGGHHARQWVLRDINLTIGTRERVGLIGCNGAGKSTLLNLLGGMDHPSRGRITRQASLSWTLGLSGGFQGALSGSQNAKFVMRVHGVAETALAEKLAFVREFSELGDYIDAPMKTYSSGMRSRFAFALSLAFRFDVYLVDELIAVGDAKFKQKSKLAFEEVIADAGLIMVSHDEGTLKNFCQKAIWINDGEAVWFDDVNEALKEYRKSVGK